MKESIKQLKSSGISRCEICKNPNILITHHINGREIPNANHSSNLANICANCHNEIHYGRIIVEKWVMSTGGPILFWHKKGETSITGEDSTPNLLITQDSQDN
jgi:hypothetical protein